LQCGNVEKSRQRRSRHFAVLTYAMYAPRVKMAAAFPSIGSRQDWTDFFEHSLQLMMAVSSWACIFAMGVKYSTAPEDPWTLAMRLIQTN